MATTLIDTRKSIMEQIHASWNQFRTLDYAYELLGFQYPETCKRFLGPMVKDFKKNDAPWSIKQSVLERNAVHANKLIRLYISLNIDVAHRMPIWGFFENGVVSEIKEQIKLLKRIQKVLKLERELEVHEPLPSATSLYLMTGNLSLAEIEADFKVKVKEAKAKAIADAKRKNAALKRAKKRQAQKDAEKKKRREDRNYST